MRGVRKRTMLKIHPLMKALAIALALAGTVSVVTAADLQTAPAVAAALQGRNGFDGVVEAVRQTVVAAQTPGAVVELHVKVGDSVKAGQLLLRIDARAADQSTAASDAQVQAARASLEVASRAYERQKQLFQKKYISQSALDQAESGYKAARAQVAAQAAQAGAARTGASLNIVRAPYAGIVTEVPVQLGDMAMPGRTLLSMYDPGSLRVTAAVPQSLAPLVQQDAVRVELPGLPGAQQWPQAVRVQVLPTVDAATHTVQVRAELPGNLQGVMPGMFARLWLPAAEAANQAKSVTVPVSAIVRRAEMTGLYVQDANDKPLLRQVRLGRVDGDRVEVLSGVAPGEAVVLDPQSATRAR